MPTSLIRLWHFFGMLWRKETWHDVTLRVGPLLAWDLAGTIARDRQGEHRTWDEMPGQAQAQEEVEG